MCLRITLHARHAVPIPDLLSVIPVSSVRGFPLFFISPIPHSGGTWYVHTDDAANNPVAGYRSYYQTDGSSGNFNHTTYVGCKLRVSDSDEIGLPDSITLPMVFRIAE